MAEHKLTSVDGTAEIDVYRIEPTSALPRGGYRVRLTVRDPEPEKRLISVDYDGFAELLYSILRHDDDLRTAVRQKLFTRDRKVLEDLPPTA